MSRIEDELKRALRRQEPSDGFTDRVMARIASPSAETKQERSSEKPGRWRRLPEFFLPVRFKWAMASGIACLLFVVLLGTHRRREYQRAITEIAEGERAKQQVVMAMKIASAKLNVAQKKVQESTEK